MKRQIIRGSALLAGAASVALTAAGLVLYFLNVNDWQGSTDWVAANLALRVSGFALPAAGLLVAIRRPEVFVGWLMLLAGCLVAVFGFSEEYAGRALILGPGSLPAGQWAAWAPQWLGAIGLAWLAVFLLLFPGGRLQSRRWIPIAVVAIGSGIGLAVSEAFAAKPNDTGYTFGIMNPFGIASLNRYLAAIEDVTSLLLIVSIIAAVASLGVRYVSSRGDERKQIAWVGFCSVVLAPGLILTLLTNWREHALVVLFMSVALVALPVAMAVAILKYRLYDIDYIINRALVYGPLTALLAGLYAASIQMSRVLLEDVTGIASAATLVGCTLVFGAVFAPARTWLQSFVDRHFGSPPVKKLTAQNEQLRSLVRVLDAEATASEFLFESVEALNSYGGAIYATDHGTYRAIAQTDGWDGTEAVRIPMRNGSFEVGFIVLGPPRSAEHYRANDLETVQSSADLVGRAMFLAATRPAPFRVQSDRPGITSGIRRRVQSSRSRPSQRRRRKS
jgi:hypothetical protein